MTSRAQVPARFALPAPRSIAALIALASLAAFGNAPLGAQSVRGTVVDAGNDRPVGGALVRVRTEGGEAVAATAADADGRFELPAVSDGVYRIDAEALGYRSYTSEPLRLGDAGPLEVRIPLAAAPVPIEGVEVTSEVVNRRIRDAVGMSPGLLRLRPIRSSVVLRHAEMGHTLADVVQYAAYPNMEVLRTRDGPCFRFRGRGCLPVYLDGARLSRSWGTVLPLDMISTVVVVLPTETVAFPEGAVHVLTYGFMR